MRIPVLLLVLFFFAPVDTKVKCTMKDTFKCFFRRGKCRTECRDFEEPNGLCLKLNAKCCM
uniref:Beta-defensin n=1 Tax=Rhinolophus ferrumequinum TaxID=59479 RepID=A0A671EJC6_RHIFE